MARAGGGAVAQAARSFVQRAGTSLAQSRQTGRDAAWRATGGQASPSSAQASVGGQSRFGPNVPPAWAQRLQAEQRARHARQVTAQAIKEGDRPGAPANPDLEQRED
jgi:type IV secretion system protein TrbL